MTDEQLLNLIRSSDTCLADVLKWDDPKNVLLSLIIDVDRVRDRNIIAFFDGGHSRIGVIELIDGQCSVCKVNSNVMAIDASEDEYMAGRICKECVFKAFQGALKQDGGK